MWYFEPDNEIAKGWHHGAAGLRATEDDLSIAEHLFKPTQESAGDMELMDAMFMSGANSQEADIDNNGNGGTTDSDGVTPSLTTDDTEDDSTDSFVSPSLNGSGGGDFCWISEPQTAPRWPSAAYEGLVGNVLPPLLEFSAHRFPKPKDGLFPSQSETHEYLLQLAKPLRPHIKTCQEVLSVKPVFHGDGEVATWEVMKLDWTPRGQGKRITEEWDGVIIAAGAFDHPYYPPGIPGLQPLLDSRSSLIMHAKTYPGPKPFLNQRNSIVVVGNANSANDICAHLAPLNSSGPVSLNTPIITQPSLHMY